VPSRISRLLAAILLCAAAQAAAQDAAPDPFQTARFRFGGVALSPGVSVSNFGWDSNVLNSWNDPQGDFTFAVTPQTDVWVRMGPTRVKAHGSLGYVYFAEFAAERSWNTDDSVRFEVPLIHFRPYVGYSYLNTRDRPGYEIDARVRRTENALFTGLDMPLTRKTTVGASFNRKATDYAEGETFQGSSLRFSYNRTTDVYTGSLRYALTPLTTLLLDTDYVIESFDYEKIRDSSGIRVVPGVDFKPLALISGSAKVGFRQLNFKNPAIPDYTGPVASVNLGYTLMGITRFGVQVDRDVQFSYEQTQPYYVLTGITGTITQGLSRTWDVQARAGNQQLAYRRMVQVPSLPGVELPPARTDNVVFYGGGIGYRVGTDVRIAFNVDYYTRQSDRATSQYEGLRAGTSVTYGF
jgi:hypothetical protein